MTLTAKKQGNTLIIQVENDRIDASGALGFKDEFVSLVSDDSDRVILNLENVEFIDSSGLGAVVAAMKTLKKSQKMDLAALHPIVRQVFKLTKLDTVFDIFENADAALNQQSL